MCHPLTLLLALYEYARLSSYLCLTRFQITGNYNGLEGDCRAVPDFYAMFSGPSSMYKKPMAISETAMGFDLMNEGEGPSELDAKSAWWEQVFSSAGKE